MMKEELGLIEDGKNPIESSLSTFVGFNLIGIIPLLPFVIFLALGMQPNSEAFMYSVAFTLIAFFVVGTIKGKVVKKSRIRSGIFTVIIGGIAALVAYLIGYFLNFLVT